MVHAVACRDYQAASKGSDRPAHQLDQNCKPYPPSLQAFPFPTSPHLTPVSTFMERVWMRKMCVRPFKSGSSNSAGRQRQQHTPIGKAGVELQGKEAARQHCQADGQTCRHPQEVGSRARLCGGPRGRAAAAQGLGCQAGWWPAGPAHSVRAAGSQRVNPRCQLDPQLAASLQAHSPHSAGHPASPACIQPTTLLPA